MKSENNLIKIKLTLAELKYKLLMIYEMNANIFDIFPTNYSDFRKHQQYFIEKL